MDLPSLRSKIDSLDGQLVALLNERAQVAVNIGLAKRANTGPADATAANETRSVLDHVHQPAREMQVYDRVRKLNHGPLLDSAIEAIYREIMSASIALQRDISVAYLGPRGSFTSTVAYARFGDSVAYSDLPSIPDVIHAVFCHSATYGVVPIENSTMGSVDATLDALVKATKSDKDSSLDKVRIRAEHYLPIHHCLLSKSKSLKDITKVYSHSQSLGQTAQWCEMNLKGIERVAVASNSAAAVLASNEPGTAAICSDQCAEMYDLNILEWNIEDKKNNTTRFFILGDKCEGPTGNDKTVLYFTVDHRQPGSLVDALNVLKTRSINLTKMDSRPSGESLWNYYFFVEFSGHFLDENVALALKEMEAYCLLIKVLGSFPDQRQ